MSVRILAIETSCDETAAAVVEDGRRALSSAVFSQIDLHRIYGGVVPEIASRSHVEKIGPIVEEAMAGAGLDFSDLSAVAVTAGPGLIGCLIAGVSYAKGLALATGLPIIPVHHTRGHIAANYIAHQELEPPFLCLVVSGGHSSIIGVDNYDDYRSIGGARDDAAGEAFDKAARALGLPYPGGPELEKAARSGDPHAIKFPSAFNAAEHFDFSFSGMKTAVVNAIHNARQKGRELSQSEVADIAASFQQAVVDALCDKSLRACAAFKYDTLALAGGVAANSCLRETLAHRAREAGIRLLSPPMNLCTDNAAMIGAEAYFAMQRGGFADMSLNARASWKIDAVKLNLG